MSDAPREALPNLESARTEVSKRARRILDAVAEGEAVPAPDVLPEALLESARAQADSVLRAATVPDSADAEDAEETLRAALKISGGPLDEAARDALKQGHDLTAQIQLAVEGYTPPTAAYPRSTPGRYLEDIARMIQAGFNTKLFFTGFSGWDNHSNLLD